MRKSFIIIVLAVFANLVTAQTSQKQTAQVFSMKDLEELRIVNVVEGLQGPTTGLDIVSWGASPLWLTRTSRPSTIETLWRNSWRAALVLSVVSFVMKAFRVRPMP